MIRRLLAEGAGSFILAFAVGSCNSEPFAVGGSLWAAMIFTGFVSGAQFNPAVSLALIIFKLLSKTLTKEGLIELLLYILIQVIFSLLGALLAGSIVKYVSYFDVAEGYLKSEAFFAELMYSILLTGDAIMVGQLTNSNLIGGGIVALSVAAGNWSIGKITGGCFNPAVGFAINITNYGMNFDHFENTWIYVVAPFLGGVVGSLLAFTFTYELKHQRNVSEIKSEAKES
jgi:glycerol uptake facilitator-like aquaporin